MIPPHVLTRKSLFSLLYKIDLEQLEKTRAKGCPFVGDRFIAPIICESLAVVPLIFARLMKFVSACAAVVKDAAGVFCPHRYDF
jgi:hypothetical protein